VAKKKKKISYDPGFTPEGNSGDPFLFITSGLGLRNDDPAGVKGEKKKTC
jgi:hypothetical protein